MISMLFKLCASDKAGTMSVRQLAVMAKLAGEADGRDFGEMARELRLSKPAMTRAVIRLIECGLVTKSVRDDDKRKVMVRLTAEGNDFCRTYFQADV